MKEKIYSYFLKNGMSLDYDVYNYSLLVLKRYLTVICITIPITIYLHIFVEAMFFVFIFSLLRKYIGGFHTKNNLTCMLLSICSSVIIPLITKISLNLNPIVLLFIMGINIMVTIFVGTIDHKNKKLTSFEIKNLKVKAVFIELLYILLFIVIWIIGNSDFAFLIVLSITTNIISICVAFLQQVKKAHK